MSKPQKEDPLNQMIEELTSLYAQAATEVNTFKKTPQYKRINDNVNLGNTDRIYTTTNELRVTESSISEKCELLNNLMASHFKKQQTEQLDVRAEDALALHKQLEELQNARNKYIYSIPTNQSGERLWGASGSDLKSPYEEDIVMSTYVLVKTEMAKPEFNKNPEFNMAILSEQVITKIAKYDELYQNMGHARTKISDNGKMIAKEVGVFIRKCMKEEGKGFGKIQDFADFFIELKLKIKKAVGLVKENDHITTKLTAVGDLLKKKHEATPQHNTKPSAKKPEQSRSR